jgi:hypothetical protein
MDENTIKIDDKCAPDGSSYTDGSGLIRASFAQEMCAGLGLPLDTSSTFISVSLIVLFYPFLQSSKFVTGARKVFSWPTLIPSSTE